MPEIWASKSNDSHHRLPESVSMNYKRSAFSNAPYSESAPSFTVAVLERSNSLFEE